MKDKIAILMATYNGEKYISEQNEVFIYDNASDNIAEIKNKLLNLKNIFIKFNNENVGIAKAQNNIITELLNKKKYDFLFFLDQDSFISEQTLSKLVCDYKKCKKEYSKIASISAVSEFANIDKNKKYELVSEAISSGMLIPVLALENIGLMRSDFFIDMVDYEWCWRARSKGWIIIQDNTCPFVHQIENTKKVLNKIPAAPFRLYYVYRNSIYILRNLPYGKNKGLKYKLFKQLIFNSIFCSKRKERLKYIILGINDGVKNQLGKLS